MKKLLRRIWWKIVICFLVCLFIMAFWKYMVAAICVCGLGYMLVNSKNNKRR